MSDNDPSRDPPANVKAALRQEVGFGCPMRDVGTDYCGSPYLQYHHFDPPWRVKHHHNPEGMVAVCATHHGRIDNFTIEQCRELKETAQTRASQIVGRFDWMRRDVLAVVGGDYVYETPVLVQLRDTPLIWFNRDEHGHLLLNLDTPDAFGNPRVSLRNNDWIVRGDPEDVESPPKGRKLVIRYADGDRLVVKFREWESEQAIARWHPSVVQNREFLKYPLTTVDIWLRLGGRGIDIDPKGNQFGTISTSANWVVRCGVGYRLG